MYTLYINYILILNYLLNLEEFDIIFIYQGIKLIFMIFLNKNEKVIIV